MQCSKVAQKRDHRHTQKKAFSWDLLQIYFQICKHLFNFCAA